jgi:hypothetical protein
MSIPDPLHTALMPYLGVYKSSCRFLEIDGRRRDENVREERRVDEKKLGIGLPIADMIG